MAHVLAGRLARAWADTHARWMPTRDAAGLKEGSAAAKPKVVRGTREGLDLKMQDLHRRRRRRRSEKWPLPGRRWWWLLRNHLPGTNEGQVKRQSNCSQTASQTAVHRRSNSWQSNGGQTSVKQRSNGGQTAVKWCDQDVNSARVGR